MTEPGDSSISRGRWLTALCLSFLLMHPLPARAFQLVTDQEAALPDDPSGNTRAGISRGPKIVIFSPANLNSPTQSPLPLQIQFRTYGGAKIDRSSIVVIYKKLPPVDVTLRVLTYVGDDGIDIESAELPPGMHRFQINVSDDGGRKTTEFFTINVAAPSSN